MVDRNLPERALSLDADSRRELRDAISPSLDAEVGPHLVALLDSRITSADTHPEDIVPWETVRDRARAKVAGSKPGYRSVTKTSNKTDSVALMGNAALRDTDGPQSRARSWGACWRT